MESASLYMKTCPSIETSGWCFAFDDSSIRRGADARKMLYATDGIMFLSLPSSSSRVPNNKSEYEALIIVLISTLRMGILRLVQLFYIQKLMREIHRQTPIFIPHCFTLF